jgi:flagellar biosynthetic protein FliP
MSVFALFFFAFFGLNSFGATNNLAALNSNLNVQTMQMFATLGFLALFPTLLLMMTSFTRLIIALSFIRQGIGVQSLPPGSSLAAMSLFLTFFIMHKPIEQAYFNGIKPYLEQKIDQEKALEHVTKPFYSFMTKNVREKDLRMFCQIAKHRPSNINEIPMRILIPSFMLSEIKRGFEMGFLILLPFAVVDIVVSILLVSLGMMMVPPVAIALPIKVILFSLADGWNMLFGSLVRSFAS